MSDWSTAVCADVSCMLPLDLSVWQQPVLPLDISILSSLCWIWTCLSYTAVYAVSRRICSTAACATFGSVCPTQQPMLFLDVSSTAACAVVPGRVCSTVACASPGRICSAAACAAPWHVSSTADWTCLCVSSTAVCTVHHLDVSVQQ
jgi:hypothetical protein